MMERPDNNVSPLLPPLGSSTPDESWLRLWQAQVEWQAHAPWQTLGPPPAPLPTPDSDELRRGQL
jgi:hypothetical protein